MADDAATATEAPEPAYARPWPLLGAGLGLAVLAWWQPHIWKGAPEVVSGPVRFLLLVAAGAVLLAALVFRFRRAGWDLPSRIETAAMVSLCGIGAIAGYFAMAPEWVSGKVLLGALFILCLAGTVLILLPSVARRVVLSLIVLFHFAGLATAITVVDPPGDTGPWLSKQLWLRVYRPYLSFLYLTNAYHFYSPNPGPPALLWFAVQYDDGSYVWVKLPDRANSPVGMHYQRMLALPEHSFAAMPRLPVTNAELRQLHARELAAGTPKERLTSLPAGTWEAILHRRYKASHDQVLYALKDQPGKGLPIPFIRDEYMNWGVQYREPNEYSKQILGSVAKRVMIDAPARDGARPRSVKMYRVVANLISPYELASGIDPLEKTKHWGYFLGEYDATGRLLDPREPFLYWYLPIVKVAPDYPRDALSREPFLPPREIISDPPGPLPSLSPYAPAPRDGFLLDCIEMHAAGRLYKDKGKGKVPGKENK